jgi:hypothetical protein
MTELKTYSVVLNWQDGDYEQGTFGTIVRAVDHDDAEKKARKDMRATYAEQMNMTEEEEAELEPAENFGGSVIEISEGAIWMALDLEKALRALRLAAARFEDDPDLDAAKELADKVLGELDGID